MYIKRVREGKRCEIVAGDSQFVRQSLAVS